MTYHAACIWEMRNVKFQFENMKIIDVCDEDVKTHLREVWCKRQMRIAERNHTLV